MLLFVDEIYYLVITFIIEMESNDEATKAKLKEEKA